jgi:hypothetical protein
MHARVMGAGMVVLITNLLQPTLNLPLFQCLVFFRWRDSVYYGRDGGSKKKVHILLSSINKLLDRIQHSYHKNIDAPKSILWLCNCFMLISFANPNPQEIDISRIREQIFHKQCIYRIKSVFALDTLRYNWFLIRVLNPLICWLW